jgi:hypothetical protein
MAKQWQQISLWGVKAGKSKILFSGAMTTTVGNTSVIGWTQLRDECASNASTALAGLAFATKIS